MKVFTISIILILLMAITGCTTQGKANTKPTIGAILVKGSACTGSMLTKFHTRFCPPLTVRDDNGNELLVPMYTDARIGERIVMLCEEYPGDCPETSTLSNSRE